MGYYIRNSEFVDFCKELTKLGNSQTQIIQKAKVKFELKSVSRHTIRRAIQEGVPSRRRNK